MDDGTNKYHFIPVIKLVMYIYTIILCTCRAVAKAIINNEKWEEALRNVTEDTEIEDNTTCCTKRSDTTTTPLRKLIRKMPEVAKMVLNKCIVSNAGGKVRI